MSRRNNNLKASPYWRDLELEARERAEKEELIKKIGDYTVADVVAMHKTMLEQDKLLDRLTKEAINYGRVIDSDGQFLVVDGRRVEAPEEFSVDIGDWVICSTDTGQITEKAYRSFTGEVVTITRVIDNNRVEIGTITGSRVIRAPKGQVVNPGEDWLTSGDFLIERIDRNVEDESKNYEYVTWDMIGGLTEVKQELREAIQILRSQWDNCYNLATPKGILLYGPPGNGKTLLGKAVATELCGSSQQFIYIKGPEILSKFVGQSEERIRKLFLQAKESHQRTGYPSIIFIDECDSIMNTRGSGRSSDVERTIVPAFLTEMDGLERSHAFIMLATNRPDTLDPAIVREGRIDLHVHVGYPDRDAVYSIFSMNLEYVPCQGSSTELAEFAADKVFGRAHLSGATCVAICERAKRSAARRDLDRLGTTGVGREDIEDAIQRINR